MKSEVFFTDFRVDAKTNIQKKLVRLIKTAGFDKLDLAKKFVAIKMHFGEPGNLAFLRPNYAKTVVDCVKEKNGVPFLTDSNTLYSGRRANAIDHLNAAYENGFSPFSTGCNVIIADGLKGNEYVDMPVKNGVHIKNAKIGCAVANADVIISLTHFKGHEMSGFGGAIKNIGMGSASRAGKMEMHSNSKPQTNDEKCVGCNLCVKHCAHGALTLVNKKAKINYDICVGCGQCLVMCQFGAMHSLNNANNDEMCEKMAEYTQAIVDGKEHFHIAIITDVSPLCDCWGLNDTPIVPNIGMLASFDPIALDQACADLVNKAKPLDNNVLTDKSFKDGIDKFNHMHPDTNWKSTLKHGEKIGLGTTEYNLTKI